MFRRAVYKTVCNVQKAQYSTLRSPDRDTVLYGLIGINLGVAVAWHGMDAGFMTRHFTLSMTNLRQGRWHTLLTHGFSHYDVLHLGTNMLGLYFAGRAISHVLGPLRLIQLYVVSALSAAAADLSFKQWTTRSASWRDRWWSRYGDAPTLGASSAVNGLVTLFCCLFPKEIIYVNFIIPVPAFLLGILFILHDFSSLKSADNVSHAGHLGGVAAALIFFLRLRFLR